MNLFQQYIVSTIREDVLAAGAYSVSDATGLLKLDAMENPYPLPEQLQAAVGLACAQVALNRYPSPRASELEQVLRQTTDIPDQAAIMFGNGSDELLQIAIQACCRPGDVVLSPVPSFVMYAVSAQWSHAHFVGVDTLVDFQLDMPAMLRAIAQYQPKVIFLAHPNNPTGRTYPLEQLHVLLKAAPGLVVIDEAYAPFSDISFMSEVLSYPNVVVVRTLSKLGLAGARLGYLVGASAWVEHLDKVRPPYNINVLTRAAVTCVLSHSKVLQEQASVLKQQRLALVQALEQTQGVLQVFDSQANFILFRVQDADAVFTGLKRLGVLIKNMSKQHHLLANCLRVTVSTPVENKTLIVALRKVLVL